ncbi:hypothetical protein [Bacillus pseudomycoides]|uniref:hypothetical protein n=1 Tax=Bacillus pseudomycoides TaxID=64104 RepID=UPI002B49CB4B|nr:hypothetical protein [Bacillus pseudomycoides]MEB3052721.1 hypothetical protein [Bacillus pseudomycoides]
MKTNTEYGLVTERKEEKVIIKYLKQFLANDKRTISKTKNPPLLESKLPFKYKYFYFNLNKEMGTYIALFPNRDEDSNYKYPDNKEASWILQVRLKKYSPGYDQEKTSNYINSLLNSLLNSLNCEFTIVFEDDEIDDN